MIQEPCVSGWSASIGLPVPVTEKTCLGLVTFAEQAVNTPNDEGWNRCPTQKKYPAGTDGPPNQGGMGLLGFAPKKRRLILTFKVEWACLVFSARKVFLVLAEWCPSKDDMGHSVPPNTTRSTRKAFSVGKRDPPLPFLSDDTRTSHGKRMRERTNSESYPSKKHQEADVSSQQFVTCSRIHQGWITKTITKKVTKEANQQGVSLRGKHRRTHRQSRTRQTDGTQGILHGKYYLGMGFPLSSPLGLG